ncbi:APC family permease [Nostocoides sp.]|uniref:APC family permease n=1 Tax=Nostocoides sp. TaxID=1917966 RepID=UPI002C8BC504|nr:APC family permease [Tetrasphaera sp.]
MAQSTQHLNRSLGTMAIVGLGLGYMTPTVIFDTFGIVSEETNNVVPLAYLMAMVAMGFTAISYGRMVRVYPSAGSAYTYASETIHPNVGFVIGWSSLLDYLLLPLVNALILRSYMESFFPDVTPALWVFVVVAVVTSMVLFSMSNTSKLNGVLVIFSIVLIVVFVFLTWRSLARGEGNGTPFSTTPLWHEGASLGPVITGATIVCFSFIGFDAISMYTEEAKDADTVPRAIVITLLIGGAIFFIAGWFAQSRFPTMDEFSADALENSALPEMAFLIGGNLFKAFLTAAAFAATLASGLASHASVSRMLYVMGRNGRGPISRMFSFVHPRWHTPALSVLFVGLVSLLAIPLNLSFVAALINFGALMAFSFVNLTVIVYFAIRKKLVNTPMEIFRNVILPALGVIATVVLWVNLSPDSFRYGVIWLFLGIGVMLVLTRFFTKPLRMTMEEELLPSLRESE